MYGYPQEEKEETKEVEQLAARGVDPPRFHR